MGADVDNTGVALGRAVGSLSCLVVPDGVWGSRDGGMPLAAALSLWAPQLVGKMNSRVRTTCRDAAGHPHAVPAAMLMGVRPRRRLRAAAFPSLAAIRVDIHETPKDFPLAGPRMAIAVTTHLPCPVH